jgi:hypothetical protein
MHVEFAAQQSVGDLEVVERSGVASSVRMEVAHQVTEPALHRIEVARGVKTEDVERPAPVHPAPRSSGDRQEARPLA